jgi:hypothetical protein
MQQRACGMFVRDFHAADNDDDLSRDSFGLLLIAIKAAMSSYTRELLERLIAWPKPARCHKKWAEARPIPPF